MKTANDCKVDYVTVSMDSIMDSFVKGFNLKEDREIWRYKWFVSPDGKDVVFEITTFPKKKR